MRPAWRLGISSLSGRLSRTILLTMAVLLSSALIAVVSCSMASIHAGMRTRMEATVGGSDLRLTRIGKGLFEDDELGRVRAWPETRLATPRIRDSLALENPKNGKFASVLANGIDIRYENEVRPFTLADGAVLSRPGDIMLDEQAAKALGAGIGDTLHIRKPDNAVAKLAERLGLSAKKPDPKDAPPYDGPVLKVAGITKQPALGMGIVLRSEVLLDLNELRTITARGKLISDVDVILRDSSQAETIAKARAKEFEHGLVLSPATKITSGLDKNIRTSQIGMTIASLLAYFAAAFIIMTGLMTSVTERLRELAMVRCIGGTKWQLAESQLVIGLVIGCLGAVFGVPLGMLGAYILVKMFPAQLPGGFAANPIGLATAVGGSILAGLLGAAWPAVRASRTTPLDALAARSKPAKTSGLVLCFVLGVMLCVAELCIIYLPSDPNTIFWGDVLVGVPATFIGYFLLSVPVFVVITKFIGPVVSRLLGIPAGILQKTVLATPYRFGFTAGAMMLGLALFISIWTNGRSVLQDWLKGMKFPDAFVAGISITDKTRQAIEGLPFVTDTVAIQMITMRTDAFGLKAFDHTETTFIAFEPEPFFKMTTLMWVEGSPETAIPKLKAGGSVLVAREFQTTRGIKVGDKITLRYDDKPYTFEVVGVVSSPGLDIVNNWFEIGDSYTDQAVNAVFGSRDDLRKHFGIDQYRLLQIGLATELNGKPLDDQQAMEAIRDVAGSGILDAGSGRAILNDIRMFLSGSLYIFSLVAVGAMLVACFGVSNLIVAGIQARQFEFGVLRAIGAQRGLLTRLVLGEAILIALTSCIMGTIMGTHGAKAGQRVNEVLIGISLSGWPPIGPTAVGWLVLMAITLLAAAPAAIALGRKEPRELLAAVRG